MLIIFTIRRMCGGHNQFCIRFDSDHASQSNILYFPAQEVNLRYAFPFSVQGEPKKHSFRVLAIIHA